MSDAYWRTVKVRLTCAALVLLAIGAATNSRAQDLEPRSYSNIPLGLNFLVAGYGHTDGNIATDPAAPLENAKVALHAGILAYARSFELRGQSAKADVIVPYVCVDGSADVNGVPVQRDVCGLGDLRLRLSANLFGAPALTLEEYSTYQQDVIVGFSLQVFLPVGQYESDKLLNIGNHRWQFKPELGISKRLGAFTLELATAVDLATDNNDFFGGHTLERNPLVAVQGHVIYNVMRGVWVSLDANFYAGGRTTIDGVESDNRQENTRIGATASVPLGRQFSIKLYGSTGITTRTGSDFDAFGAALQYRWGAGL